MAFKPSITVARFSGATSTGTITASDRVSRNSRFIMAGAITCPTGYPSTANNRVVPSGLGTSSGVMRRPPWVTSAYPPAYSMGSGEMQRATTAVNANLRETA